jgi:hypothetical protein
MLPYDRAYLKAVPAERGTAMILVQPAPRLAGTRSRKVPARSGFPAALVILHQGLRSLSNGIGCGQRHSLIAALLAVLPGLIYRRSVPREVRSARRAYGQRFRFWGGRVCPRSRKPFFWR